MLYKAFLVSFASIASLAYAASTFSPARPPAIPLAVRSPYVSAWLQAGKDPEEGGPGNGGYLAGEFPTFWAGENLGWTGLVRVDGTTYTWMGNPMPLPNTVNQTSFTYTSTRSTFIMSVANLVQMNITFLSPVTSTDMMRQSLPFSYLDVSVTSTDGAAHEVQLYSDVTAEWVSGNRYAVAEWQYGVTSNVTTGSSTPKRSRSSPERRANNSTSGSKLVKANVAPGGIAYHQFYRQTQLAFSETLDQTDYGNWYYATDNVANLTYQSGSDVNVRGAFTSNGTLASTNDTNFRAINNSYPTFAFAIDLGAVSATPVNTLFTIGLAQQEAVQFDGASGNQTISSLWTSYYSTDLAALAFFHGDYSTASGMADTFDSKVVSDSTAAGGSNYVTITTLAARQAFGGTQLAGNSSTMYLFLKEISSDGNVQTVDVIFPFHTILLYTNPELLKMLLDPLFINQESGQYPNKYSMHDLGTHFPNATGHALGNDEMQPVEECGNMLIMTLAYAQRANDNAYLTAHYKILNQWTQYLIMDALIPGTQISTDDFAGALANQTNLALKGIIGISAMAKIANLTGNTADATNYTNIAQDYITQWQSLGIAHDANPPHTTLAYGQNNTHGLLYNLYADRELGLNLVPQSVYDMQSNFYPTVNEKYGVPLDTRHDYVKNDWQLWAAAITASNTTDLLIGDIATYINETPTNRAIFDLYNGTNAEQVHMFRANAVFRLTLR